MKSNEWAMIRNLGELQEWERREIGSIGGILPPPTYPALATMEILHQNGEYVHSAIYVSVADALRLVIEAGDAPATGASHHAALVAYAASLSSDALQPATTSFTHTPAEGLRLTSAGESIEPNVAAPAPSSAVTLTNMPSGMTVKFIDGVPVSAMLLKTHMTDRRGRPVAPPPQVSVRAEMLRIGWEVNASAWSQLEPGAEYVSLSMSGAKRVRR